METLHNGFTLELAPGAFPLSTDSMVLGHFVKLPRQAAVLDLGAGCGGRSDDAARAAGDGGRPACDLESGSGGADCRLYRLCQGTAVFAV